MKTVLFLVAIFFGALTSMVSAQTMSYGPLYANGTNAQGFPIFMLRCSAWKCLGPQHKDYGSPKDVARYTPPIPAAIIDKYGYHCIQLCWDPEGNIVGRPALNWRDPYLK